MNWRKIVAIIMLLSLCLPGFAEENAVLPLPSTGNVTLPLAEYNRLIDLATKAAKKHEQPPVAYTLKHADINLRVGAASVLGTVALEGEVFSKAAAKVPLVTGLTILNAQQQGKPLPLEQEGSTATAVLPGTSEFSVALETGLPLLIETGRASFNLPAPSAGSVRLSLSIPGDRTLVRISPGLITSRKSENGSTLLEATLAPGQTTSISWATRDVVTTTPTPPKEVRFLSDVKTLLSIGEADLKIAALADINVIQGEATQFSVAVPAGYEITGASGATVDSSEIQNGVLVLHLTSGSPRSQQFLITMERPLSAANADAPFLSFKNAQRETGEVLVEGSGAMEVTAKESGGLKRIDIHETSPYLRALAHNQPEAAFRYHRQPEQSPALALEWTRFPDTNVLAAVAEHATVTTLVTVEGRSLTEVKLTIKNQAQPFLKVNLPSGATIVSAEVAGERVKPVEAPDGNRVPLLRPGFRPSDSYEVSYVFMHSGTPFAKKGGSEIALPAMDIPVSVLEWEVFLPEQYKVKNFGGDVISANLVETTVRMEGRGGGIGSGSGGGIGAGSGPGFGGGIYRLPPGVAAPEANISSMLPGQIGGVVLDPEGAVVPGARVTVTNVEKGITRTTNTDQYGAWVASGMPAGQVKIEAAAPGFRTSVLNARQDSQNPGAYSLRLDVDTASETIVVTAQAAPMSKEEMRRAEQAERDAKKRLQEQQMAASSNVNALQQKVAGILPVRVDVPRAGNSYHFARALVLDEQTRLTFNYKNR
jgi:hypothetical protein